MEHSTAEEVVRYTKWMEEDCGGVALLLEGHWTSVKLVRSVWQRSAFYPLAGAPAGSSSLLERNKPKFSIIFFFFLFLSLSLSLFLFFLFWAGENFSEGEKHTRATTALGSFLPPSVRRLLPNGPERSRAQTWKKKTPPHCRRSSIIITGEVFFLAFKYLRIAPPGRGSFFFSLSNLQEKQQPTCKGA